MSAQAEIRALQDEITGIRAELGLDEQLDELDEQLDEQLVDAIVEAELGRDDVERRGLELLPPGMRQRLDADVDAGELVEGGDAENVDAGELVEGGDELASSSSDELASSSSVSTPSSSSSSSSSSTPST